jgi:XapX domain-containing protein
MLDRTIVRDIPSSHEKETIVVLNVLLPLSVGVLAGAFYAGVRVRSPAPPLVALIGLLGIWLGEHLVGMFL